MNGIFSPIEVDILYFLYDRPNSSGRDILVSVESVNSRASMKNMITRLMRFGAIDSHRDVLFSLAPLGMCLIGRVEPEQDMLRIIHSLGLTSTPLTRTRTSYWQEVKSAPVTLPKEYKNGARPRLSVVNRTKRGLDADGKRSFDTGVMVKPTKPASFNVKTVRKPGEFLMQQVNIKHFHFNDNELLVLERVRVVKDASTAEFHGDAVKSLVSRRYICEQGGVINATFIGRAMLFSPGILQGLSTLNLTRDEIVLFELSLQNNIALIKIPAAIQRLKCTGSTLDKSALKLLLDSWCDKGWAIRRSNNMYYFTFAARVVAGVTAVTKRAGPPLLDLVGVKNLSFVTEQAIFSGIEEDNGDVKMKKQKAVILEDKKTPSLPENSASALLNETTLQNAEPLGDFHFNDNELAPRLSHETAPTETAPTETAPTESALIESVLDVESDSETLIETGSEKEEADANPLPDLTAAPTEKTSVSTSKESVSLSSEPTETPCEDLLIPSLVVERNDVEEKATVAVDGDVSNVSLDFLEQAIKDVATTKSRMNEHKLPALINLDEKVVFLQHVRDVFFLEDSVTANRILTMIIDDLSELKAFLGAD
jgi:hypothetical protein